MQITIDLENMENQDIKDAIIQKINDMSKEDIKDIKDLFNDENFRLSFSNAIRNLVLDIFTQEFNIKQDPKKYGYNSYFYTEKISRDKFIYDIEKEKDKVVKEKVTETVNSLVSDVITIDNFTKSISQNMPELIVTAMCTILYNNFNSMQSSMNREISENIRKALINNRL